jgi:hypothetical protein
MGYCARNFDSLEGTVMPHGDIETFHEDGEWHNRVEGEAGLLGSIGSREEAAESGKHEAIRRRVEHIIRKVVGTIGQRNSYGHDPRSIHG